MLLKRLLPEPVKRIARNALEHARLEYQLRRATPVFVWQMGKVGSKSIYYSLSTHYPGAVLHAHRLSATHEESEIRRLYEWAVVQQKPLDIISLTREPIGRNVSAFFENFGRDTGMSYEQASFSLGELKAIFLANYEHDTPLQWFDNNIRKHFGIDVYATPYPENGTATYGHRNVRLLVIRLEAGDAVISEAIKQFLGLTAFELIKKNVSQDKDYAMTYDAFTRTVKLPDDYIARMCESKYFTHFYSQETIDMVRKKWRENA